MHVLKIYTIPTCLACVTYTCTLHTFCCRHNIHLEIYDVDSDPLESIKYMRQYRGHYTSVPFVGIYDDNGMLINCISGIHTEAELENIYEQYRRHI
jgi:hypothetical protein